MNATKPIKHFIPRARKNINHKVNIKIKHTHTNPVTHNTSKNPNVYRYTAAIAIMATITSASLAYEKFSLDVLASIIGVSSNLIGAILIASGVHLDKDTKRELQQSVYTKNLNSLTNVVTNASNTIFIGILYIICGSILQILVLIP
ncbi:MAG: hypothetical protein PHF20_03280 [Halothiobacillaceae bacterium]|nr:hypothetical protein [Halothiobacillaceae bacterium]